MNILQSMSRKLAHMIGRVRLSSRARWMPPLGGFLLTIVLVGVVDYFFAKTSFPPFVDLNTNWKHKFGDWLNIWTILAIYTFAWLLLWSMRARRRMVVEKFANYAGKDFEDAANGASMMLLVKLGQLHDLYQAVDEQRAISTAALGQSLPLERYTAIDAAINVDTIEAFLKDAVSIQSTLNLGPLQIPIGILLSFFGHLAQGPRISGSFQKDRNQDGKNLLILAAQAKRNGKSFTWRVERELSSEQLLSADLTDMIDEFACRIFTDMTLSSTVRWRAAARFAEGLRAYRECLRTPKDRIGNLQLAEEKFIETLTEDTQYTLAHYNLGVVLTELHRQEAATTAFERSIREDSRSSQAYYALALSCYQSEQYYRTSQICKRVIVDLKPDPGSIARAYQLKAMALAAQEYRPDSDETYGSAIRDCKKAIMNAYKALRRAEITQQDDASGLNDRVLKAESLLSVCIGSLAKIYLPRLLSSEVPLSSLVPFASGENLPKAKKLLNAALQLHSSETCYDALYHWELGRIWCAEGKYEEAAQHLRIAVRTAPDRIEYLADLIFNQAHALARSTKNIPSKIPDLRYEEFLFQTLLDLVSTTQKKETVEKALETVLKAYEQEVPPRAKYQEKGRCVRMIRAFLQLDRELSADTTPEKLASKTDEQLAESYELCKRQYDICTAQCYSYDQGCEVSSHRANGSASALLSNQKQQVINPAIGKINKPLCLSQIVLAWGRIQVQLSRKEQNKTDHLGYLLNLLGDLDAQVQAVNNQTEWEWERGQILSNLAQLYYETGKRQQEIGAPLDCKRFEQAACYYRQAIDLLQKKYSRGVNVQNLRSSLAAALLELPPKRQEALKVAQESITFDAMNYKNYETLGEVYFACEDFSNAIETWKQAIARKNTTAADIYDPQPYMRLGNTYVALAQSRHGICLNDQQCQEAVRYLEHALKCCTGEHVPERLKAYCSLGYLHYTRGDYDQAIQYLRLTQSFGFAPCTSSFYLADAYLRKKDYDAAFRQFRSLQEKTKDLSGKADEILEAESSGHICLNEMKALAFWGQAYILVERDIYSEGLLGMAQCARRLADELPAEKRLFASRYAHCEGWILYKLDKLEPPAKSNGMGGSQTTNGEKAIEILREAARLEALPEIYLHLAQACQNKLTYLSDASEKQRLLANIRAYCQHARDLNGDDDNSHNLQLDDLLKSLPA